jgi:integrase/recombinase XerD
MFNYTKCRKGFLCRRPDIGLGKVLEDMANYLRNRGYAQSTIQLYLGVAKHFGRWLADHHVKLEQVTDKTVRLFIRCHLPRCSCTSPVVHGPLNVRSALHKLLIVLRAVRSTDRVAAQSLPPIEKEVQSFDAFMTDVCGLASGTRRTRRDIVIQFLKRRFGQGPIWLDRLKADDLIEFITNFRRHYSAGTTQNATLSLRSYLRFLQFRGLDTRRLIQAVPTLPHWNLAEIPRTLTDEQLERLLESFDRSTNAGCRDYAIVRCLADLGLRVEEVTRLTIDDVDWRQAILRVYSGKVRSAHALPLPDQVGRAIAAYVYKHRPKSESRHLFLRHRALEGRPVSFSVVRSMVRRALNRAGVTAKGFGPHVLRRTFATRMVQRGVPLHQVAEVLGHQSLNTTAIYTKVNLPLLTAVAMPWPGVRHE